jgi:hypothetical protein
MEVTCQLYAPATLPSIEETKRKVTALTKNPAPTIISLAELPVQENILT